MASETLYKIAQGVLDASVEALTCSDNTPPTRQFVSLLRPSVDCEMVVVYPMGISDPFDGATRSGSRVCARVPYIDYLIEVWRCVGSASQMEPTTDEMEAAALVISKDGWLLWADMTSALVHNKVDARILLEGEQSLCYNVELGQVEFIPVQGGYSGVRYAVRVEADGFGCGDL